jgi:hypothetical protein
MGNAISSVRWSVEVFPWEPLYPGGSPSPFADGIPSPSAAAGALSGFSSMLSSVAGDGSFPEPDPDGEAVILTGVTAISFNRKKGAPDNFMRFVIRGPVDRSVVLGSWVVLRSTANLMAQEGEAEIPSLTKIAALGVPRFIGMITDMSISYTKDPSTGLLSQQTTVMVRSWGAMLMAAIRFDDLSIIHAAQPEAALGMIANSALTKEAMNRLHEVVLNPFEYVHLIFQLIGVTNTSVTYSKIEEFQDLKLSDVSVRMPAIPKALLTSIGLDGVDNKDPFTSGFVSIVTGTQTKAAHNDGSWDGLFGEDEISNSWVTSGGIGGPSVLSSLKEITSSLLSGPIMNPKPKNRPNTFGMQLLFTQGFSAWELASQYSDPEFNELFTDIWYELSSDKKRIIAKPVIVLRDKPFALRSLFDAKPSLSSAEWTKYDDLPRIRIPAEFIQSFSMNPTTAGSFNYIRLEYTGGLLKSGAESTLSRAYGTVRSRKKEILRFGGMEYFPQVQFIGQDFNKGSLDPTSIATQSQALGDLDFTGGADNSAWFIQVRDMLDIWWGEYYKTPTGSLSIKDCNLPLAVGMNIIFRIGDMDLVGHVNSLNFDFSVQNTGLESTSVTISLDRITKTKGSKEGVLSSLTGFVGPTLGDVGGDNDLVPMEPYELTNVIHGKEIRNSIKAVNDEGKEGIQDAIDYQRVKDRGIIA